VTPDQEPTLHQLIDHFQRARQRDAEARESLDRWFQRIQATLSTGYRARQQLESLAYCVSEQDAARQLRRGGAFQRLQHDAGSVAYRHRERLRPFFEALERGEARTVEQFVDWVSKLTGYVLLDMQNEDERERQERASGDPADIEPEAPTDRELSVDEQRALLADLYQRLDQEQFIVLLLVHYARLTQASAGKIMGMEEHNVRHRLRQIAKKIGEMRDEND
jgi:DNA-directed RNA polymerase specialized sigma24 family protein